MANTADLEQRGEIAKQMNDMIMQSYSIIPLVHRGGVSAHTNTLGGIRMIGLGQRAVEHQGLVPHRGLTSPAGNGGAP